MWAIRLRCKVNWFADLRPTQDRSLGWCWARWESDKPSLNRGVGFIKNLTQFKRIVSRDISERSKITTTLADKIVLETFWLRHRERQPDLPPVRELFCQGALQRLVSSAKHTAPSPLLTLRDVRTRAGKHTIAPSTLRKTLPRDTLCLFLSSVPPKMPRCTANPARQLWI